MESRQQYRLVAQVCQEAVELVGATPLCSSQVPLALVPYSADQLLAPRLIRFHFLDGYGW